MSGVCGVRKFRCKAKGGCKNNEKKRHVASNGVVDFGFGAQLATGGVCTFAKIHFLPLGTNSSVYFGPEVFQFEGKSTRISEGTQDGV